MNVVSIKTATLAAIGVTGSLLSAMFGGFDSAFISLLIFMAVDYISGLIVAGVFHRSLKSPSGALDSTAGWKGLCRKGITLSVVLVCARLDIVLGTDFIRDGVVIAYMANECLSIIENAGLMGIPIPDKLAQAIEVLKKGEKL